MTSFGTPIAVAAASLAMAALVPAAQAQTTGDEVDMVGFAFAQLVCGPLSDAFAAGRSR